MSTTGYVSDKVFTTSASSMSSSTSTLSNSTTQGTFPKTILQLMENGLMTADEQIKGLFTDLQYSENFYALKYILQHKGDAVSVDVLNKALKSILYAEKFSTCLITPD